MKNNVIEILNSNGIKNVGFCDFLWLKDRLLSCRANERLPQNAKTVIMCAFPYKVKGTPPKFLSRYAAVPDYHTVCGNILKSACEKLSQKYPQNKFECFCDNSPIPEVFAACAAGLGLKGDNGLLINPKYGSFVFLGEIVTDLYIETQNNYAECEHCGRCRAVCPVSLDKTACLSNISQKKNLSEAELQALKQNKILWGCDICATACPHNLAAECTDISEFINGYRDIYTEDEDSAGRPYTWRGENVIKRNHKNLKK